jgi:hypothetical protein
MPTEPAFRPRKERLYHKRERDGSASPAPAVPPTLLEGSFDDEQPLILTFDRAINIDAFDGSALLINDPRTGGLYHATDTPTLVDPTTLHVPAVGTGEGSTGTQTTLTASAHSGIVAADGGAAWTGCTDFHLS